MLKVLVLLVVMSRIAFAEPCVAQGYTETSVWGGISDYRSGGGLIRQSVGVKWNNNATCESPVEFRIGPAFHLANRALGGSALGLEAELDLPIVASSRVGVRGEVAVNSGTVAIIGVRYRIGHLSLGFDGLRDTGTYGTYVDSVPTKVTVHALMFGVGVADTPGKYTLALDGLAAGLLMILAVESLQHSNI